MSLTDNKANPLPDSGIRAALQPWGLERAEYQLISHSENVVYKVLLGKDRYILRIHRPGYNTIEELESEHLWTQALNAAGIRTPAQIQSQSGNYYHELEISDGAVRAVGVMEWLEGTQLAEAPGTETYQSLGVLIAQLHNQSSSWITPNTFRRRSWNADGLMGLNPLWGQFWVSAALTKDESNFLADVRKGVHAKLASLPTSPELYGLIHADLHPHNVLVVGRDLFAIDFDDCGFGWHYYDIAVALHQIRDNDHFEEYESALLAGYRSIRPLPDAETLLPLFYLVRSLVGLGWISARPELATIDNVRERVPAILREAESFTQ